MTETAQLEIRLFGSMQVCVGGQPLPRLRSRKGLWLLALLALRAGRDIERDWLAGVLWPDCRDTDARRSLRQSLHDLRVALGSEAERIACGSPRTLRLDVSASCFVDTLIFDAALPRSEQDTPRLEAAVHLYTASLLEDCTEDWVVGERRQREQQYVVILETLAAIETTNARHAIAANYLRFAVGVDPLREDLQRALMESLTAEGNAPAAELVYRRFRDHLWREMNAEPDVQTTALYRRLRSVTEQTARTKTVSNPVRIEPTVAEAVSFLPQPRTTLIGREEAVAEVAVCLTRARLVTLTGAGGVGKTRLAVQVAEETSSDFEGGIRFVPLAAITDPDGVSKAVQDALGVTEQGDVTPQPIEELCRYLASRRLLLVLDNCEHVLTACAALVDILLSACPNLRVLCTSREALRMRGELVWRVPSLAVPPLSATEAEAIEYPAVRLFVARAEEADATFRVSSESLPALVRVCRRLDGIPLALELAATRVRMLAVEEIDRRLEDRFRLLTGGDRAALPRQQTLQALIDWSYDLLTASEKMLFARLSVFAGGWTLDAAEAVCGFAPLESFEVLDLMTSLLDKSLIVAERGVDGAIRYRMLETLQQYAAKRTDSDEIGTLYQRHLHWFLTFADKAESLLQGAEQIASLARLEKEHDNLRAALDRCVVEGEETDEAGLRLLDALWQFWLIRGYVTEGRQYMAKILRNTGARTTAAANALRGAGSLASYQGDQEAGWAMHHESLSIFRELGDERGVSSALHNLGNVAFNGADFAKARLLYEESLVLHRQLGDRKRIARSLNCLGNIAYNVGDVETARILYTESLTINRESGDTRSIAMALNNLGNLPHEQGDFASARSLFVESLALFRELGDKHSVAYSLESLAGIALSESQTQEGVVLLGVADALREELGAPHTPSDQATQNEALEKARSVLGKTAFDAAWGKGRGQGWERTAASVLGEVP